MDSRSTAGRMQAEESVKAVLLPTGQMQVEAGQALMLCQVKKPVTCSEHQELLIAQN